MRAKISYIREMVLGSYWFVPGLMTLGAMLLAFVTLSLDARLDSGYIEEELGWLIYTGGPDGARGVLETIAGSMITVAGVVFSITIVALTLASSQFGPRVLANFMRDRGNQIVLGTFIATFLFCLLILRTVRSEFDGSSAVVPHVSVTVGVALALTSLGVLIFFIHHVSISIQAPHLIGRIADDLHGSIDQLFPETSGKEDEEEEVPQSMVTNAPEAFDREAARVIALKDGYIEAIDMDGLLEEARSRKLLVRLEHRPGHFVVRGSTLARLWPGRELDEELESRVREAVVLGPRRTAIQDVEFVINQLVEVAVRALSPGINDPFTALNCIDRLGGALCHLASRRFPSPYRLDEDGEVRLVVGPAPDFAGIVDSAFHQIRQNASYHVSIYIRLLETLARAVGCACRSEQIDVLLRHADLVLRQAEQGVVQAADQADVEGRYRGVQEAARRRREELGPGR